MAYDITGITQSPVANVVVFSAADFGVGSVFPVTFSNIGDLVTGGVGTTTVGAVRFAYAVSTTAVKLYDTRADAVAHDVSTGLYTITSWTAGGVMVVQDGFNFLSRVSQSTEFDKTNNPVAGLLGTQLQLYTFNGRTDGASATLTSESTADFFYNLYATLRVGDLIFCSATDGGQILRVTASSSTTVTTGATNLT